MFDAVLFVCAGAFVFGLFVAAFAILATILGE